LIIIVLRPHPEFFTYMETSLLAVILLEKRSLISIKRDTNHPWVKQLQVYSCKGPYPIQSGDHYKSVKVEWGHSNSSFQEPLSQKS
jgi:hypothetical protein